MGKLDALGAPHPFEVLGHWCLRLLEEGIVCSWWHKGNGSNDSLTKLYSGSTHSHGDTHSPSERRTGEGTRGAMTCWDGPQCITQGDLALLLWS